VARHSASLVLLSVMVLPVLSALVALPGRRDLRTPWVAAKKSTAGTDRGEGKPPLITLSPDWEADWMDVTQTFRDRWGVGPLGLGKERCGWIHLVYGMSPGRWSLSCFGVP
jgi:hypothetical protein